ncbi:MAG TPA: hypothetical protein VFZ59_00495 [Verrucomicrobiae bacterium]|nr:hypothetical protein [Verrucomicrobiae bacterium]
MTATISMVRISRNAWKLSDASGNFQQAQRAIQSYGGDVVVQQNAGFKVGGVMVVRHRRA